MQDWKVRVQLRLREAAFFKTISALSCGLSIKLHDLCRRVVSNGAVTLHASGVRSNKLPVPSAWLFLRLKHGEELPGRRPASR